MSLSALFLALYLFFVSAGHLGWFDVGGIFLGIVALLAAILLVVESGPVVYKKYLVR